MRVCVFASSSSGNCLLVSDGDAHFLIDAGISMRRIFDALAQAGLTMADICGILITHEHADHVSGLKMLLKHYPVKLYAPHTVANRLMGAIPEAMGRIEIIPVGECICLNGLEISAFHTCHDTDESVGYRICGNGIFAIATDTGRVTEEIEKALMGADTVLIEANHDVAMLSDGPYPVMLKRRILSERGHLSNESCARLARHLAEGGTREIILGHLSQKNNTPRLALAAAARELDGLDVRVSCAPVAGFEEYIVTEGIKCLQ